MVFNFDLGHFQEVLTVIQFYYVVRIRFTRLDAQSAKQSVVSSDDSNKFLQEHL